mmetsp:Transcript_5605/g.7020  ORF Transcript_5605/g.7020 Transcript_5605/m.7020 type:complete len:190 (-) Transcript_5605:133-702(-)|eukprot:CAMPEP_0172501922 /NCGR_PEP_ID=MMETSP1066-20121228/155040_1 /TAXON_ID=671091 /ORGANISM="Coscinodiscus wailesii, Strain CCMP2513" /LENGTH=189 /DNA_ID=CAMNT_0013276979 /DNA_START=75 /DNA_END=644 /DNA_ORIENTATION=+
MTLYATSRCGFTLLLLQLFAITISANRNLRCNKMFEVTKAESVTISPLAEFEKCLRANFENGGIEIIECNLKDSNMQWWITESGRIYSRGHEDLCLTGTELRSLYDSAPLRLTPCIDYLSTQSWSVGCGKIKINGTNICAQFRAGDSIFNEEAKIDWCDSQDHQLWIVKPNVPIKGDIFSQTATIISRN